MHTIKFTGKVLPECSKVSIKGSPIKWDESNFGSATFDIKIQDSLIVVECRVDSLPGDLTALYMRAFDLARAAVDLISFANGWGLSVILDTVIDDNGSRSDLFPKDPALHGLSSAITMTNELNNYNELYQIVLSDPSLFMALNDLIACLIYPHHSAVNSARVLERIKNLIAPSNSTTATAWLCLHKELNVEKSYLISITDASKGPRHGEIVYIPGTITSEVTRKAWIIMNRFLEYRKRGNGKLPESDFPLLK